MSNNSNSQKSKKVEEITSVQRRRRWSTLEKLKMIQECELPRMTVSYVARQHGISPSQLFTWRRQEREGKLTANQVGEGVMPVSEVKQLEARIRELERLLGKKTMENEMLKDAAKVASEKNRSPE